jgi:hypothetical protein
MPSGRGGLRAEEKGWVDVETLMVVPPSCYHNGNLEDHREKCAIRTLPTRKESFTRAILALYHFSYPRTDHPSTGLKPRAFFLEPARRKGWTARLRN